MSEGRGGGFPHEIAAPGLERRIGLDGFTVLVHEGRVAISGQETKEHSVREAISAAVHGHTELEQMTVLRNGAHIFDPLCLRGGKTEDVATPDSVVLLLLESLNDPLVGKKLVSQSPDVLRCRRTLWQDFGDGAPANGRTRVVAYPVDGDAVRSW